MVKKPDESAELTGLRRQAEERLRVTNRDVAAMPVQDVQRLVQELQVYQVELEMQNEELRRTQAELEEAHDRYVDLHDFSPAGHLMLYRHGTIMEANVRAGALLGLSRKDLIRQPLARFIAAEDEGLFRRHCQETLRTGTRQTCEVRLRGEAGVSRWVYLESLATHEESGTIIRWRTALLDISDRKAAELELVTQRQQLEAIIGSAMDAIITVDEQQRVVVFNRAAESMFSCSSVDAIGQSLDRFIPARFRLAHQGHVRAFAGAAALSRPMDRLGELKGLRTNGEEFPFEASISHVLVEGKRLLTVILRDITERKQAELALRESQSVLREKQEELQGLAEKLLTAQDRERRRIARELHDDFNQRLAALSVELGTLERAPIAHPEPVARQLAVIRGQVGRLSDDLQELAYKLHPSLLEHVGLEVAMRDHVAEFTKRTGLPVTFTAREVPESIASEVGTNLFRVMQESLQNVMKHAQATEIAVRLSGSSQGIGLSVQDNGRGFALESKRARVKGLGLVSMQERTRLLSGLLSIQSRSGQGTKVCAWIPLAQEEA